MDKQNFHRYFSQSLFKSKPLGQPSMNRRKMANYTTWLYIYHVYSQCSKNRMFRNIQFLSLFQQLKQPTLA